MGESPRTPVGVGLTAASFAAKLRSRPSARRAAADLELKPAWDTFLAAGTVLESVEAYRTLRASCGVPAHANGRASFDAVLQATSISTVPHRTKSLMQTLANNWKQRPVSHGATRVLISGAGPVGLRAAVESALLGMRVHVIEKRDAFSRVNILMLWQPTADDLIAYGARVFYPKFTNRNIGTSPLHLGTREIQLVLLKNALLLGVAFSYGRELVALQAPHGADSSWSAWAFAASGETSQTSSGVLDFKPNKSGGYSTGIGQGRCNQLQTSELDPTFAVRADTPVPGGIEAVSFDALLLAEGEWSGTCAKLGVTKSIDRFSQALGLVINLTIDPEEPATKDPRMRSFVITPLIDVGRKLKAGGIRFEFGEYLKGETHYIVLVLTKACLLEHGALLADRPGVQLLTRANLDEPRLLGLARKVATLVGLPESTAFTAFHPAKLFDFSTRARCVAPFRTLDVVGGGARAGDVIGSDLEAHAFLRAQETAWMERALAASTAEVNKRHAEVAELSELIVSTSSNLANLRAGLSEAADAMLEKAAFASAQPMLAAERPKVLRRQSTGVQDDEWGDEDDAVYAPQPTQAEIDARRREEYGVKAQTPRQDAEEQQVEEARLEAYKKSMVELEAKLKVQEGFDAANRAKRAEWLQRIAAAPRLVGASAGGGSPIAPIFPIGDSLLEPFWPQGLGSNRGFHSALDAVWAVHVMQESGLEAALLERTFWYDLMLQGPWTPALVKPAACGAWSADPVTRYADGAIVRTKSNYTNPQSKRLFRGDEATPARIRALGLSGSMGFM